MTRRPAPASQQTARPSGTHSLPLGTRPTPPAASPAESSAGGPCRQTASTSPPPTHTPASGPAAFVPSPLSRLPAAPPPPPPSQTRSSQRTLPCPVRNPAGLPTALRVASVPPARAHGAGGPRHGRHPLPAPLSQPPPPPPSLLLSATLASPPAHKKPPPSCSRDFARAVPLPGVLLLDLRYGPSVPPQLTYQSPDPQHDGVWRGGLRGVIGVG